MATRIDTLKTYEAIAAAGVDDKAARAISNAIAEAATDWRADLATKSDLDGMVAALETVKSDLRTDIAKAQLDTLKAITDSTRWNAGIVLTVGSLVAAAVKFL